MKYLILILVIVYATMNLLTSVFSAMAEDWKKLCKNNNVDDTKMDELHDALLECDNKFDQGDDYANCMNKSMYKNDKVKRLENLHWLRSHCDEHFLECVDHEKHREVFFIVVLVLLTLIICISF